MDKLKKFKISYLKRKNLYFGSGFSIENVYNCKWLIDWTNSVDKNLAVKRHENDQIIFLKQKLDLFKPDIFIDIGAHGGLYSIIFKKKFSKMDVHAIEPDIQNRYQLYSNIFLNNMERNINVHSIGFSNKTGEASFGIKEQFRRGGKGIFERGADKIEIDTLDNYFDFKNKSIFIKIDVEGHEIEVLEGAKETLRNNRCLVQTEILFGEKEQRIFDLFEKNKYDFIKKITTSNAPDYYFTNSSF